MGACKLEFQKRCNCHEVMKAGSRILVKDGIGWGLKAGRARRTAEGDCAGVRPRTGALRWEGGFGRSRYGTS